MLCPSKTSRATRRASAKRSAPPAGRSASRRCRTDAPRAAQVLTATRKRASWSEPVIWAARRRPSAICAARRPVSASWTAMPETDVGRISTMPCSRSSSWLIPARKLSTRSSSRSAAAVRPGPVSSTRRQARSGASGVSALQWAPGSRASARPKVGARCPASPCAATTRGGKRASISTPAHRTRMSRSNGDRPNKDSSVSSANGIWCGPFPEATAARPRLRSYRLAVSGASAPAPGRRRGGAGSRRPSRCTRSCQRHARLGEKPRPVLN